MRWRNTVLLLLASASALHAQQYTRGVGVYPGDPNAYNGAELKPDTETYRNLALHRPAYASSSYDYNLTAQLVTDGIRDTRPPQWVSTATSENGTLPRNLREHPIDDNPVSSVNLPGTGGWIQVELGGREPAPEVDRVEVFTLVQSNGGPPQPWTCVVLGSEDGQSWTELGRTTGSEIQSSPSWWRAKQIRPSLTLSSPSHNRFYRVKLDAGNVTQWRVGEVTLFDKNQRLELGGPYSFTSAWKSSGSGEEWVYVDLGAECTFDHVLLFWIQRAAEGELQVSDDAKNWQTIEALPHSGAATDDLQLATAGSRTLSARAHDASRIARRLRPE